MYIVFKIEICQYVISNDSLTREYFFFFLARVWCPLEPGGGLHWAEWVVELLQCVTAGRGCRQQPAGMLLPNRWINCWSPSCFFQVQGPKCLSLCSSEPDRTCVQLLLPTGWTGGGTLCWGSARHRSTAQPSATCQASGTGAQGERISCFWWIQPRNRLYGFFPI